MKRNIGLTLIELMISMAIGIFLLSVAAPATSHFVRNSEATSALNWLVANVVFARHSAIVYRQPVTLCPSADGLGCGGDWHEGTIVFTDRNKDRKLDPDDELLKRFPTPVEDASIKWRSFGNRQYLQMTPVGYTYWQNGNFVYCPQDKDLRYARQLVINIQGRARSSKDVDGDGFVEDRYGKHLRC